ncbi:SMC-Scp complex subunit ScpB [Lacticaseibacillus songhuajiangensis]|uniref:SMC-Scp complex subunit ScpB n=1 Tax=Lacticaseibacillus songhuajiangensis TaxID=1296539 RepID=UPI000F7A66F5|nr:SMC-Scp complex subunit ScpB [Lacticaseibacillus songhuajiangensis]MCI1284198.1 SMC-Scp complex subunit ScpB [Lacticaseibacillus songhuajiangensis]
MNAQIEAILYAAGEDGVDINAFSQILGIAPTAVRQQLDLFMKNLNADDTRGLTCRESDDRYFLLTKAELAPVLKRYFEGPPSTGLSQAALEVLAIIAYQQPVTRIEVDQVRGVQSSGALQTLVTRQLVQEAGRMDAPGRPIMYATSPQFLDYFGLHKLSDLPDLDELPAAGDGAQLDLFDRGNVATEESSEEDN